MDTPTIFACPRQPGNLRLSPKSCAAMYRRAKRAEPWESIWHCRRCDVGAEHAGEESPRQFGFARERTCVRCGDGGKIIGRLLCVSCYNRQAEWIKQRNRKGKSPVAFEVPAIWSDADVERIVLARGISEAEEAYRRLYAAEPPPLARLGSATPAEGADWWSEVKRLSRQRQIEPSR